VDNDAAAYATVTTGRFCLLDQFITSKNALFEMQYYPQRACPPKRLLKQLGMVPNAHGTEEPR
jgi:hypothetical protein